MSSSPTVPGSRVPISGRRGNTDESVSLLVPSQLGQRGRSSLRRQNSSTGGPSDASHQPSVWDEELDQSHQQHSGTPSDHGRPSRRGRSNLSRLPASRQQRESPRNTDEEDRRRERMQARLQSRLMSTTSIRRGRQLGVGTVLNVQKNATILFQAMFCPDIEHTAVHPRLHKHLNLAPRSFPPGSARKIIWPHGFCDFSGFITLAFELTRYNIGPTVEDCKILDERTPYHGIDIYFGRAFLNKYCDGKLPRDILEECDAGEDQTQVPAIPTETVREMGAVFSEGHSANTPANWGTQGSSTDPLLPGSAISWEDMPPAPSAFNSSGWPTSQTYLSTQLAIRQDPAWPYPGKGTLPAGQWQGGHNITGHMEYPMPSGYSTNHRYVQTYSTGPNGSYSAYPQTNLGGFYLRQQYSGPHHGSTPDGGMSGGYEQGMRNEPFTRPDAPQ
ncbi:hypothetical protein V8F20_002205 [Naviculisporaceae sp. PSN 640]